MDYSRELRELQREFDKVSYQIEKIVSKGKTKLKELERLSDKYDGSFEEDIDEELSKLEKVLKTKIDNLKNNLKNNVSASKESINKNEEYYLNLIEEKERNLKLLFEKRLNECFIVEGEL